MDIERGRIKRYIFNYKDTENCINITFLPWDDRLATVHVLYHVWGPVEGGHPGDHTAEWALYFAAPDLAVPTEEIKKIVERIVWDEKLTPDQEALVKQALRLTPPEPMRRAAMEAYEALQREFSSIVPTLECVVRRARGEGVLKGEVRVFPSFEIAGTGGSAYRDAVGINPNVFGRNKGLLRVFVHELLHVFVGRDEEFSNILRRILERYELPVHGAHVEALTNIVWWRAGRARRMFERYYDPRWRELVRFEQRYRKILRAWWRSGGSLLERIRDAFL